MSRAIAFVVLLLGAKSGITLGGDPSGSGTPPLTYELMINGETFLVEADRLVKLESQEKPGVTYDVALRIALEQRVRLNTFRFEYDWPAKVADDRRSPLRSVRIRHELGFTMLITDLGQPLDAASQEKTLKSLRQSTVEGFQRGGMQEITVEEYAPRKFAGSAGQGLGIRYRDDGGFGHTCLVYLMTGPTFAGYCVVDYFDADEANAVPRVRKTLESIRAIGQRAESD